jgi:hypothetical protein
MSAAPLSAHGAFFFAERPPFLKNGAPSLAKRAPSLAYGALFSKQGAPSSQHGAPSADEGAPSMEQGALSWQKRAPFSSDGAPFSIHDDAFAAGDVDGHPAEERFFRTAASRSSPMRFYRGCGWRQTGNHETSAARYDAINRFVAAP